MSRLSPEPVHALDIHLGEVRGKLPQTGQQKILLGQLGALGDCIYATAIARQIKIDYPDCHLTWAIGSMAAPIIEGNPSVDAVWEIPATGHAAMETTWFAFEAEVSRLKKLNYFHRIFLTQVFPNHFHRYDGTVRASIFRGYPHPVRVDVTPQIYLSQAEVANVSRFVAEHRLSEYKSVILFESTPSSGQSFVDAEFIRQTAEQVLTALPDAVAIISAKESFTSIHPRLIDGSTLSFKENAELTRYCHLLVGCSSGLSWLCTSQWAKPLPTVQLLKKSTSVYASMCHDFRYQGKSTDAVLEMTDCPPDRVAACIRMIHEHSFSEAKAVFHEEIPLFFDFYMDVVQSTLLKKKRYAKSLLSLYCTVQRYGLRPHWAQSAPVAYLKKVFFNQ